MPPLKTNSNEPKKHLPIIDADAKLNFLRCPHCGYRNSVPFGLAYSTVKCQDCGKYLIQKPERKTLSRRHKGKLILQLLLFVIMAGLIKYVINNTHFVSKTDIAVSEMTEEPPHAQSSETEELSETEKSSEQASKDSLESSEAESHTETPPPN